MGTTRNTNPTSSKWRCFGNYGIQTRLTALVMILTMPLTFEPEVLVAEHESN